jgi:phage gp36-like protein
MSYCSQANLIIEIGETELIQLTDRNNLGVIDTQVVTKALTSADATINAYLTAYTLPLTIVPANFELLACDIACYYLNRNRVNEPVKDRYNQAIKYLEQIIGKGLLKLEPDTTGSSPVTSSDSVDFSSSASVFSRESV